MKIKYLDGPGLKQAVIAASRRVILMQEKLNRINVFPVPDNDTGTNMALTMQSIAEGAISCHDKTVAGMSRCMADSALTGARGNSGAILAQFFQGLAERFQGEHRVTAIQFGDAVIQARNSSYDAIAEPEEGTILTVIHDWAVLIKGRCHESPDFKALFREGLRAARISLKETPEKLKLLAKAEVVDAGAQGFVHMLEGVYHFIHSGKLEKAVGIGDAETKPAKIEYAPQEITFQYCTECFIAGKEINRRQLRTQLKSLGNSLIVAGSAEKVRVHIHTNEPKVVFRIAGDYGKVSKQKIDDMRRQHAQAREQRNTAQIALVTDSSCDLPSDFFIRHNIQMVPVQIAFGTDSFIDKITITPQEFYRLLERSKHEPKTSQPSPGEFLTAYEETLAHYQHVVAIHLSGALSGTLQAAQVASRATPAKSLQVIDSKNVSVGLGLIVAEAAHAIEEGAGIEEVLERVRWARDNVKFYIYFDTIEYLIRGGRLHKAKGLVAEKLHVKPILAIDGKGEAETIMHAVGEKLALRNIMKLVRQDIVGKRNLRFAVAHANAPKKAEWLCKQIQNDFEGENTMVVDVSPALGAHAGPGAAGVAFLGES